MKMFIWNLSLLFCVITSSCALNCFQCQHMTDIDVSVPGYKVLEDHIKQAMELQQSANRCSERSTTSLPSAPCQQGNNPICTSTHVNMKMSFTMETGGSGISMNVSGRVMGRACAYQQAEITYKQGCHDASEYESVINDMLKGVTTGSTNVIVDLAGNVCACSTNNCNNNLPNTPPPVGQAKTTTMSPPPAGTKRGFNIYQWLRRG